MAVPKQKSVLRPTRQVHLTTKADEEDMLDWDTEIDPLPPRPTRVIRVRIVHGPKRPPKIIEDEPDMVE
ncbi:MAG: hypothetical protein FJ291_15820 [Planctomycetes bacterium]|nr:hypothetical protein [Planctomycetota bacterium]